MTIHYPWPSPPGYPEKPVWTGSGFRLGQAILPIFCYDAGQSGWTDQLTRFHDDTVSSNHFRDRISRQHALQQICRHVRAGCLFPSMPYTGESGTCNRSFEGIAYHVA